MTDPGATKRELTAVIFDFGGVLTEPVRAFTRTWLDTDGIDPDTYRTAMRDWLSRDAPDGTPIHRLETGELAGPDFETELAARLRRHDGRPVPAAGLLNRMFAAMTVRPDMLALLAELRGHGLKVGVLSNSWGLPYPPELAGWCDASVISGDVGLRKPDPRIYRLMLDRLGIAGADAAGCAFVDDAPVNVAAATELGLLAVRHRDPAGTRAALAAHIPDLTPTPRPESRPDPTEAAR